MLDAAREKLPQEKRGSVDYVQSPAEELSFLPDNSVDMVAAGALSHYISSAKHLNIALYHSTIVPLVRIPQGLEGGFKGVEATGDGRILGGWHGHYSISVNLISF